MLTTKPTLRGRCSEEPDSFCYALITFALIFLCDFDTKRQVNEVLCTKRSAPRDGFQANFLYEYLITRL